jgi:hypothetical protein
MDQMGGWIGPPLRMRLRLSIGGLRGPYSLASRPHPNYYCYDCHGYRYFDPYYDWCAYYGFRFGWSQQPGAVAVYRERYVRIKENHPEYGRYRYRAGYREDLRFRESRDYDAWRGERSGSRGTSDHGEVRKPDRSSPASHEQGKGRKNGHRGGDR